MLIVDDTLSAIDSIFVKNNIVSVAATRLIWWESPGNSVLSNNLYYDTDYTNKFFSDISATSSLAAWQAANSQDANSVQGNPLFTTAGSDFTLKANSPAIDAGVDLGATYKLDYSGSDQYNDSRWDIGAYRFRKRGGIPVSFFTY